MRVLSLRVRLFALILGPLLLIGAALSAWRYSVAVATATELYDRALLVTALAVSRDVAISGGDALSAITRRFVADAAGGEVFYHVAGPAGSYVTGYASPPVSRTKLLKTPYRPVYFEAMYLKVPVRVMRLVERNVSEAVRGDSIVTVWQHLRDRESFATELGVRAASLMGVLFAAMAVVIWFGVKYGLRPLDDLHRAIAIRSADDLSPIKRPVPVEVQGIVETLNRLFGQVAQSIEAKQVFIANAAHQLRNPVAAVQSMAEAVQATEDPVEREWRLKELVAASRSNARVAEQLLSLGRLGDAKLRREPVCFGQLAQRLCSAAAPAILAQGLEFEYRAADEACWVNADRALLREAVINLIDNAQAHGGEHLSTIRVVLTQQEGWALLSVQDDGRGLHPQDSQRAFARFSQIEPSAGSGLGLSICLSVAQQHDGWLRIDEVAQGASVTLALPVLPAAPK